MARSPGPKPRPEALACSPGLQPWPEALARSPGPKPEALAQAQAQPQAQAPSPSPSPSRKLRVYCMFDKKCPGRKIQTPLEQCSHTHRLVAMPAQKKDSYISSSAKLARRRTRSGMGISLTRICLPNLKTDSTGNPSLNSSAVRVLYIYVYILERTGDGGNLSGIGGPLLASPLPPHCLSLPPVASRCLPSAVVSGRLPPGCIFCLVFRLASARSWGTQTSPTDRCNAQLLSASVSSGVIIGQPFTATLLGQLALSSWSSPGTRGDLVSPRDSGALSVFATNTMRIVPGYVQTLLILALPVSPSDLCAHWDTV